MDEYIKRDGVLRKFNIDDMMNVNGTLISLQDARETISNFPASDVAPVVHGRWEGSTDEWFETDVYTCSKCREDYVLVEGTPKENLWHYCPNCGARMDGAE